MGLIIEGILPSRTPSDMDIKDYFQGKRVFISSTMLDMQPERHAVGRAILEIGATPVNFESPVVTPSPYDSRQAYLHGVETSDIYVGIFSTRYGGKLPSGYSATHEEYNKAVELGLPIYIWINGLIKNEDREGNLNVFLRDLQQFHATSEYMSPDDLNIKVRERLKTVAIEDLVPLFKFNEFVFPGELLSFRQPTDHKKGSLELKVVVRNSSSFNSYLREQISVTWNKPSDYLTWGTNCFECSLTESEYVSSDTVKSIYKLTFMMDSRDRNGSFMMAYQSNGKSYSVEDVAAIAVKAMIAGKTSNDLLLRQYKAVDFSDLKAHIQSPLFNKLSEIIIVETLRKEGVFYHIEHVRVRKTNTNVQFSVKGKPSNSFYSQTSSVMVEDNMNV
jgi:hypothetical protein